jgi:hypothetical protein
MEVVALLGVGYLIEYRTGKRKGVSEVVYLPVCMELKVSTWRTEHLPTIN